MPEHDQDGSHQGFSRHKPSSPRSEVGGSTGGTPKNLRHSAGVLRRRVYHLGNELRLLARRAEETANLKREHVCSLEYREMLCANQARGIGRYRNEVCRLRAERDGLQPSLNSDRDAAMEQPPTTSEFQILEVQIRRLHEDLGRHTDEIRALQARISDLS